MVPMVLNAICTTPVRFASLEEPIEQTMAVVTQVPRLIPIITGYAIANVIGDPESADAEAIAAMRRYSGHGGGYDEGDEGDDYDDY